MDRNRFRLAAAAAALAALVLPAVAEDVTGRARVLDGDTLDIGGSRVRLYGIDAPERTQLCEIGAVSWPCGRNAQAVLAGSTRDLEIDCRGARRDRYGRLLAVCYAGGVDLNAMMVRGGWALAYRQYSLDYVGEEAEARAAGRGVWQGPFIEPWEWRSAQRAGR